MDGLQASQHWRAVPFPELEDGPARATTSRPNSLCERRVWLGEAYKALPCRCQLRAFGSLLDQRGDRLGLRHIDGVAALDLDDCRTRALRHDPLGGRGNHL